LTAIWVLSASTVLVLLAAAAFLIVRNHSQHALASDLRPPGIPQTVSTNTASLMGLDAVPHHAAPGFLLTDQHNRPVSLADFRGKVVVLEFMDPHCTDICPFVSREFVDAYGDLGRTARDVVFAAVNVNEYHRSPTAMMAFSKAHRLSSIPDWHFVTGPTPALKAVWRAYGVQVQAPNPNADIIHTSIIYFIDSRGTERYVASPMVDHTPAGKAFLPPKQLTEWGKGIADVARSLAK
jgi:protein SCO1/2